MMFEIINPYVITYVVVSVIKIQHLVQFLL